MRNVTEKAPVNKFYVHFYVKNKVHDVDIKTKQKKTVK